ncbi:YdcF family protein [Bacteroides sp.]
MAQDRIECAYNLYASNEHMLFLCTGGFGSHFNTTVHPHAFYAKQTLIQKGAKEEDFLPFILSTNTYEDFKISKDIIEKESPDMLFVITSDFHIERVKLLHSRILNYPHVIFLPAKSNLSKEELLPLIEHERNAIRDIKNNRYQY